MKKMGNYDTGRMRKQVEAIDILMKSGKVY